MPVTAPERNYWTEAACARAFWGQRELPPYRELLTDTLDWLEPAAGEAWLDLGCGGGQLTRGLWHKSQGTLSKIVGLDCAIANEDAYRKLRASLEPAPSEEQVHFFCSDFSRGLYAWESEQFDGVVSGLAIHYAESYDADRRCWTSHAYDGLLAEVQRILKPGGSFVFSVMKPEPAWGKVALSTVKGVCQAERPLHYLKRSLRMWLYGPWVTREARCGRFHYLPSSKVKAKLCAAGFSEVVYRRSFARQAYLFRCRKPC